MRALVCKVGIAFASVALVACPGNLKNRLGSGTVEHDAGIAEQESADAVRETPREGSAITDAPAPYEEKFKSFLDATQSQSEPQLQLEIAKLAEHLEEQGRYSDAAHTWRSLALDNPNAARAVRQAVRTQIKASQTASQVLNYSDVVFVTRDFCRSLLGMGHAAQAVECARAASLYGIEIGVTFVAEAYAQMPVVTANDLEWARNGPAIWEINSAIAACRSGHPRPFSTRFGSSRFGSSRRFAAAILIRYVDGATFEQEQERYCLLQTAAEACLDELLVHGTCSEVRALGRYAELLAYDSDVRVKDFVRELFDFKLGLYRRLSTDTPLAAPALFHMHLAMAFVCTRLEGRIKVHDLPEEVLTTGYHVERARRFWRSIQPNTAFPEEMLQDIAIEPRP